MFQCAKLLEPLLLKAILGVLGAMQMSIATARHLIVRWRSVSHTSSGLLPMTPKKDAPWYQTMVYGMIAIA